MHSALVKFMRYGATHTAIVVVTAPNPEQAITLAIEHARATIRDCPHDWTVVDAFLADSTVVDIAAQ